MRAFFLACLFAPAMVHAQISDPGNDGSCPAAPPNPSGGDRCSVNLPDGTGCSYDGFTWPGSKTAASYQLLCTCMGGTFACSQSGIPTSDPANDAACPSTVAESGDSCSNSTLTSSQDCQYRDDRDGVIRRCTCFDGEFMCSSPSTDADADPDNHANCPLRVPTLTGGDACSVPSNQDCKYQPFYFFDSTEVTYISRCSCMDAQFFCAQQGIPSANPSNDASCPSNQPALEGGDNCNLSSEIDCSYSDSTNLNRKCTCLSGTFACAEQTPTGPNSAAPTNHPNCPGLEPTNGIMCSAPTNSDCLYRPFYWPGSSELTYIGRCTCFDDDSFLCAEQTVSDADPDNHMACPATPPTIGKICADGPPASEDCQYREGSQNVLRCTCMMDGSGSNTFQCAAAFSPDADPDNHPFCPLTEPQIGSSCSNIPTDCKYREPDCGAWLVPTVPYIYACTCSDSSSGTFACAETDQAICGPSVICFAGDVSVDVQDHRGSILMKHLSIGDKVHVGNNRYEPVYSFGHYDAKASATFLKIQTSAATPLLVSADHMVKVQSRGFVPASNLAEGDKLIVGSTGGADILVTSIHTVTAKGVFAPFTPSGTIVVNGILASSFVVLDGSQLNSLSIIGSLQLSHQWLAHTFEFPHRLACHYLSHQCPNETYTANGVSTWVARPLHASQWMLRQDNIVVRCTFLILVTIILALFAILEAMCFTRPILAVGTAAAATLLWYRRCRCHQAAKALL